jgi:hypothetical protein
MATIIPPSDHSGATSTRKTWRFYAFWGIILLSIGYAVVRSYYQHLRIPPVESAIEFIFAESWAPIVRTWNRISPLLLMMIWLVRLIAAAVVSLFVMFVLRHGSLFWQITFGEAPTGTIHYWVASFGVGLWILPVIAHRPLTGYGFDLLGMSLFGCILIAGAIAVRGRLIASSSVLLVFGTVTLYFLT